ncbi:hypothetical protein FA95DRAFT_1610025 [Auriscalpium vulgare]|uniref:Uncharacterized protein n=1 Tax=Auriscalpium vulgare TaxID=40419 RepID=A0ACB8RFH3_9AGAM|nr:hypothetical protein FA95DRAFT_1610025 [Auriscalpium vulgare]
MSATFSSAASAASDVSSALTDERTAAVGLSDPRYAEGRRRKLDLINPLRGTGAQIDLDLPVIAVLGSQSAGKSSLIEAISGITLPRAAGTCTRCPTECFLSYSVEPWRCVVTLHMVVDEYGKSLGTSRTIPFGEPMFRKSEVTERIRRAQRAILNPRIDPLNFLIVNVEESEENQLSFSANSVCLQICGRDVDDLSFVDLPGLIPGGDPVDSALVQSLAEMYITKPSCIILLTVTCETDYENQGSHRLAAKFDAQGSRTIGVLTKPDRIPAGEEDRWLTLIKDEAGIPWYSVKNPGSQAISNGISWEVARAEEREYYSQTPPWSELDWVYRQRLGTDKLTRCLSDILSQLISRRLPELQNELDSLLNKTTDAIARLPKPPPDEPVAEILRLVSRFTRAVEKQIEGTPSPEGLLQGLREPQATFQTVIRKTAPDFRPHKRPGRDDETPPATVPGFLANEEVGGDFVPENDSKAIFVDDVMKRAEMAVTRELPNNYPFLVKKEYISAIVRFWDAPSKRLFEITKKTLVTQVMAVVEDHFGQFVEGGLKQRVTNIIQKYISTIAEDTVRRIDFVLQSEREPFTRNVHYFMDYRAKFLAFYKGNRQENGFVKNLTESEQGGNEGLAASLGKAISGLAELGLHGVQPDSLTRLLPSDPMEAAVEIMADVRAYFQVAYKRFVDNVPMTIDQTLLRGLSSGLEGALFNGLGVNGPKGYENCRRLLQEPPDVMERRKELQKRQDRLLSAKDELEMVFAV